MNSVLAVMRFVVSVRPMRFWRLRFKIRISRVAPSPRMKRRNHDSFYLLIDWFFLNKDIRLIDSSTSLNGAGPEK